MEQGVRPAVLSDEENYQDFLYSHLFKTDKYLQRQCLIHVFYQIVIRQITVKEKCTDYTSSDAMTKW